MGSGISTTSRIRAMTSAPKSERARRMKLLAGHTGALLFERIGPIAPDEINSPLLDLVDGQGSQLDQVDSLSPRFAVNRRFLLSCFSKPVDVGGDLAQRDRIAF